MEGYIPKDKRKKILFLGDDIRFFSGVGNVGKELVLNTAHIFNWVCVGASAQQHPDTGKTLDLSNDINKWTGLTDSSVITYSNVGYGNHDLIMSMIGAFRPDALVMITDPRFYIWLFQMENEVRKKIPIIYINIWDDLPAPLYNRSYYDSCDGLLCISKQTKNIVEMVLGDKKKDKVIKYFPHGVNHKIFFPITPDHEEYKAFMDFKKMLFAGKDFKFAFLFNSRNITRKALPTLILAFEIMCEELGEKSQDVALVIHTDPVDNAGTDVPALIEAIITPERAQVILSTGKLNHNQMNYLYNSCDAVVLPSSNEGWGLSLTEGMMAGKMIIANVTGGMQDQMRFEDEKGQWIDFTPEFCSNHFGRYKKHGEWARPVFPNNMSLLGSPVTPYIYDDRCDFRDVKQAMLDVYNLSKEERHQRGMKAREWAESNFTAEKMGQAFIDDVNEILNGWKPRKRFELLKAGIINADKVPHKLIY